MSFAFTKTLHTSLSCKLVPVQYGEYEYDLSHLYLIYSRGNPLMRKFFNQLEDEET